MLVTLIKSASLHATALDACSLKTSQKSSIESSINDDIQQKSTFNVHSSDFIQLKVLIFGGFENTIQNYSYKRTLFDEIKSSNYLQIAIVFGLQTL